jgi:DNA-binding NarL/FixJ family response regulator
MKILIVDDHPILREGIAALIRRSDPDSIIFQAGDVPHALSFVIQNSDIDIVLLDLVLPGNGGMSAISEFSRMRPALPVIVLSASEDHHIARRALAQGALGYVTTSASSTSLLSAIQLVLSGDLYVPPFILAQLASGRLSDLEMNVRPARLALTERQIDVLQRIGTGQSNRMIAVELDLSEKTVKAHVTAIFKALNVVSRTQAAAIARETGLI